MTSKGPRLTRRHGRIEAFRNPDWAAVMANLKFLHHDTQVLIDLHETVHLLATSLGAPQDWLHETEAARHA